MNITGLGRASLKVRDLTISEHFYTQVLKMSIAARETQRAVEFQVGDAHTLRVEPVTSDQALLPTHQLGFVIGNNSRALDATAQHLTAMGISYERIAHAEYESLHLRDPDGHQIELYYWPAW